jgi:ABC-type transport system substrate-binding protein/DNA-binding beta-propeller fold protein YncE
MRGSVVLGSVVGAYRVTSLLAEGAMGSVYIAEDPAGEPVALKVLSAPLAEDARFRKRFLRETELAANLHHPRIVPILASGEQGGVLWLAMSLIEGVDLRTLLKREGALSPPRAVDLLSQVAAALDVAHEAGLVHRDVKPGNILVDGDDAHLCDFGLARHISSVSSLTSERGFVGTIDYVPPEQIQGGRLDGRADVYSLGCVLFECLAGARPFEADSDLTTLFSHLNEPPPRLSDVRPGLPPGLDDVLAVALAKSPDDRYSTCGELIEAAEAALAGRRVVARSRLGWRAVALAVLVTLAAAVVGAVVATRGGSSPRPQVAHRAGVIRLPTNDLSLLDPRTRTVVARIELGRGNRFGLAVDDIEFGKRVAWLDFSGTPQIAEVDLRTRKLARTVPLPWGAGGAGAPIALLGTSVWVSQSLGPGLLQIDARSGKIVRRYQLPGATLYGAVAQGGSIWLSSNTGVLRVDPKSGRLVRRIAFAAPVTSLIAADGFVWAASGSSGFVAKIDPTDGRVVATAKLHSWLQDMAVGGGSVWVSFIPDGHVFQLAEGDLSELQSHAAGLSPQALAYGGNSLWITDPDSNTVSFLDATSARRTELAVSSSPQLARYRRGLLWTSAEAAVPALSPIVGQQLSVSMPQVMTDADPSAGTGPHNEQLFYETCANLYTYPDSAGPAGDRLVPEVAAGMPVVSDRGRTYTIRVRPDFRFSPPSDEAVTAETFRHTIERALSPKLKDAPAARFASDLVGVGAFRAGRAAHIAGIRARGDTISFTLVRPAGDFLERISTLYFFCPVPLSQPVVPSGLTGPIPSLGPYYQASIIGDRAVLLRNPNYHGDRPRRSARIVFTYHVPTPQAVALADAGRVDLLPNDFDNYSLLVPGGPLDRKYGPASPAARMGGQRYFLQDRAIIDDIVFNTARPLFHEIGIRRAVSDALDRGALASAIGDEPDDQLLPPVVPGGRPSRVPARRIVSIGGHRRAVLYAPCGSGNTKVPSLVRADLAPLGIAVSVVATSDCPDRYTSAARNADLILSGLGRPRVNDPEQFLEGALDTGRPGAALGPGPWYAPAFRRRVDVARALSGPARSRTYRALADELMSKVPFAVYGTWAWPMYISPKLSCLTFQAHFGFLDLGLLCKH